ncbi:MAG: hypothetical protein H6577_05300 [Lewinellaceae bacterium]|nr:hypothetical protein [Saprospiraceae bacterium]MCB9337520.1 hypothetical protein [Lewinellaceae bacterium]
MIPVNMLLKFGTLTNHVVQKKQEGKIIKFSLSPNPLIIWTVPQQLIKVEKYRDKCKVLVFGGVAGVGTIQKNLLIQRPLLMCWRRLFLFQNLKHILLDGVGDVARGQVVAGAWVCGGFLVKEWKRFCSNCCPKFQRKYPYLC